MKLSDMFSSLATSAKDFEKRLATWQEDLSNRSEDLMKSAKQWRDQASERQADLDQQIKTYFEDASDEVKSQWNKSKADWDAEVARIRAKGEEMRQAASTMHAEDVADWSEAYAANMVAYAQQTQEEASKAVAAAAEARAKAKAQKSA